MKENNENCNDLARLLKLPQCSVSWRMNEKTEFRISEIKKIMKHYKRNFEDLF